MWTPSTPAPGGSLGVRPWNSTDTGHALPSPTPGSPVGVLDVSVLYGNRDPVQSRVDLRRPPPLRPHPGDRGFPARPTLPNTTTFPVGPSSEDPGPVSRRIWSTGEGGGSGGRTIVTRERNKWGCRRRKDGPEPNGRTGPNPHPSSKTPTRPSLWKRDTKNFSDWTVLRVLIDIPRRRPTTGGRVGRHPCQTDPSLWVKSGLYPFRSHKKYG